MKPTLIHIISSNVWGGARQYALDICSHYLQQGWHVMAVTRDAKAVDDRFREAGVELHHAPLPGFYDIASAWVIARLIKQIPEGEGIIHVHRYRDAFTALLAKRIARRMDIRVISTRHYVRPGRNTALFRRIYAKTDGHIFVSQTAYDRFASTWNGNPPLPEERKHILLNSTPVIFDTPPAEPTRGPVIALYTGAVTHGKAIETAIDALAMLRDLKIRLRIAGYGTPDYLDTLRRRAMSRGVMEMIDWRINIPVTPELLADSHIGIQTSLEREAFGLDCLRFMAAGRPLVCTPNGAQREYLTDRETAIFVPPANPEALAGAMRSLATDPELRAAIGINAFRTYTNRLSWEHFAAKLTEIYLPTLS